MTPRSTMMILFFVMVQVMDIHGQVLTGVDSIKKLLLRESEPSGKIDLLIKLSDYYLSDIETAIGYSKQAYDLAETNGSKNDLIASGMHLAKVYYFKSDLKNAMDYATRSKNLAESAGMEEELAQALDAIGVIYYDIGDQNKSSECFYSSLKLFEKINYRNGLGAVYCQIGTLYLDQKDFEKAADYYTKSIKIAREIKSTEGIASNLNNLGKVYFQKKDYANSLKNFEEALRINLEANNVYLAGYNYLNIAEVYLEEDRYREAREYVYKAWAVFEKIGNKLKLAKSLTMLARIMAEQGTPARGDSMALAALSIGLDNGYKDIIVNAAEFLHKSHLDRKDSLRAFRYFIIEKQYKDSLFLIEKQKTLNKYELQEQFDKNEHNLRLARQKRNIVIIIVSGFLVFSIIIILLILKQLRLKAKQLKMEKESHLKELEFKNKELILNVMSLMKKNEILTDLSEKLIKIDEESSSPESKDTIKKVAYELQKNQDEEIWKEFSIRFKEVHGDFYNRLLQRFPTLTPNELKLCAFLRLNMSSKDIAELTGQRISTLETARYRLRQKLGIVNSEVNLVMFLSTF